MEVSLSEELIPYLMDPDS